MVSLTSRYMPNQIQCLQTLLVNLSYRKILKTARQA
jgi:hypothetical protein